MDYPLTLWALLRFGEGALRADAYETVACACLSLMTLSGLALNAALGWSWADPLAALVLVPLIAREGLEGIRGEGEGAGRRSEVSEDSTE